MKLGECQLEKATIKKTWSVMGAFVIMGQKARIAGLLKKGMNL